MGKMNRIPPILLLVLAGCASPQYSPVPPANTNALPPLPAQSKQVVAPQKSWALEFESQDRGPTWYVVESTQDFHNWTEYTNGLCFPGETRIAMAIVNPHEFFRVRWK